MIKPRLLISTTMAMCGAAGFATTAFAASGSSATDAQPKEQQNQPKRNVLFIVCDDLRVELNCYGAKHMKTPNIDALAKNGVMFSRAYCNIPVSGASRASFLTGTRPTQNTFVNFDCFVHEERPEAITIQQHFKQNGYTTISNGKIYHQTKEQSAKYFDNSISQSNVAMDFKSPKNLELMREYAKSGRKTKRGSFIEFEDYPENIYFDSQIAEHSINGLKEFSKSGQPFFMAVGFIKPHLPFVAPKKYWDMYNNDDIKLPENYKLLEGNDIPNKALANWGELRAYSDIPQVGALDEQTAKNMIHGYYAATSYVDAQVGRVLDALRELGLDKNTTIVFIGDHGWNLGEHGMWCKHCIMNTSLHVPMIISSPDGLKGHKSDQIVEYVDIYPTLCDASSINKPSQLEGESILPLVKNRNAKSKGYAVSRWLNGFTLIQGDYFYTEWWDKNDEKIENLLFDHKVDPNENYNVAKKPKYATVVEKMSRELKQKRGANYQR